ncbi:MAG: NUDIX hydrolase [Leifsonia sp.]
MADPLALAATVVLLRDGPDGAEVLLLERPHDRGSFAGAWVFPGGSVDPGDSDDIDPDDADTAEDRALRRAAVRETLEETGLAVTADALVPVARWHPPREAQKRLVTTFYAAAAPAGDVRLAEAEAVALAWLRPSDALARHAAGTLLLFPPTWVTLHAFVGARSVAETMAEAARRPREEFRTRFTADRTVALWQDDSAYADDGMLEADGVRHRLTVSALPWIYERTATSRST